MGSEIRKENVDAQRGSHILKLKSSTGHRHDAFAISKKNPVLLYPNNQVTNCCPSHIIDRHFTIENLDSGITSTIRNNAILRNNDICHILENSNLLAKTKKFTRVNIDIT